MPGKVEVVIDPKTGESTYHVSGIEGASCEDVTKAVVQANEVVESGHTDEYDKEAEMPDYIYDPMEGTQEE